MAISSTYLLPRHWTAVSTRPTTSSRSATHTLPPPAPLAMDAPAAASTQEPHITVTTTSSSSSSDGSPLTLLDQCHTAMPFLRLLQEPSSLRLLLQPAKLERDDQAAPSRRPPSLESCVTMASAGRQRKRKRSRRNVESHRRSHIEVERNRRRLVNEHLTALRALVPNSLLPRVDQATVVAGAIDFVRELEQRVQSLESERRAPAGGHEQHPFAGFFEPGKRAGDVVVHGGCMDVEARVVQTHVHVRVVTRRGRGDLVRAVSALQELHLEVLHLCVASSRDYVLYTLSLKMTEECKLASADEIASAARQIFSRISMI